MSKVCSIFKQCVQALQAGELIEREGRADKEFHFQNWFRKRLESLGLNFDSPGRNSYPDFRLVQFTEGYELKGLAYPGREVDYDCNSQVPRGEHNGRQVYYVFGRYPAQPDGNRYPVLDLVFCHDAGSIEPRSIEEFALNDDDDEQRLFVELLNRTLRAMISTIS